MQELSTLAMAGRSKSQRRLTVDWLQPKMAPTTVSRRWDLLRPAIARVLSSCIPDPAAVVGPFGTPLVDGTVCPVWDWNSIPDLYSGKMKYTGMSIQIACSMHGEVAAIGPVAVHGARHDAYAFEASGLKEILEKSLCADDPGADLGYVGVDGRANLDLSQGLMAAAGVRAAWFLNLDFSPGV